MPSQHFISLEELNTHLETVIHEAKSRSNVFYQFFLNLKLSGFRFQELVHTDLWYFDEFGALYAPTLKGGNIRENVQDYISSNLLQALLSNHNPFLKITQSTAAYWLYAFIPVGNIYHETKQIKTHLFRHYLIKKMSKDGYTTSEIASFIGERSLDNVDGYINSDLYYFD